MLNYSKISQSCISDPILIGLQTCWWPFCICACKSPHWSVKSYTDHKKCSPPTSRLVHVNFLIVERNLGEQNTCINQNSTSLTYFLNKENVYIGPFNFCQSLVSPSNSKTGYLWSSNYQNRQNLAIRLFWWVVLSFLIYNLVLRTYNDY
jgi:hypothetical protein